MSAPQPLDQTLVEVDVNGRRVLVEERLSIIREHCKACGCAEAAQALVFAGGLMVEDVATCLGCGNVSWSWRWDSTMIAARDALAAVEAYRAQKGAP